MFFKKKDHAPSTPPIPKEGPKIEKPLADTTSPVSGINNTIKVREDTIPVIVVNGVYFPTQRLRFKLNDPNMDFCKPSSQN